MIMKSRTNAMTSNENGARGIAESLRQHWKYKKCKFLKFNILLLTIASSSKRKD